MEGYRRSPSTGFLIHRADRLLTRAVDRALKAHDLTAAQLSPLLMLDEAGPMLQRDLALRSPAGQPAMVATLTILERKGLIERREDPRDRRATLIHLTDQGRAVVTAAEPLLARCNDVALAGLAPAERDALNRVLQHLADNLEAEREIG